MPSNPQKHRKLKPQLHNIITPVVKNLAEIDFRAELKKLELKTINGFLLANSQLKQKGWRFLSSLYDSYIS
jgi:hypothetical protein